MPMAFFDYNGLIVLDIKEGNNFQRFTFWQLCVII